MSRVSVLLPLLALMTAALSGCVSEETSVDFELTTNNIEIGDDGVDFKLTSTGGSPVESDHIGAHYWHNAMPTELTAGESDGGCPHQSGEMPGDYHISCDIEHVGTTYVYGHARYTGDEMLNFWSAPVAVTVEPEDDTFTLTASNITLMDGAAHFDLNIEGDMTGFSDHIGGHYWSQSTDAPTAAGSDGGCSHVAGGGDLPGTFHVMCNMGDGEWVYRGHLRITIGESQWDYWTEELTA